jgi:flagellar basal body-associated protein FliL
MDTNALIIVLAFVTFLAALGIVFWQKSRMRTAEKTRVRQPELKSYSRGTEPDAVPLAQWVEEYR